MSFGISLKNTKDTALLERPELIKYVIKKGREDIGTILYNKDISCVEVFSMDEKYRGKNIEHEIIDELISRQTLISWQLDRQDKYLYELLLLYGFSHIKL